ncbi:MAG: ABC transporter permease [Anaerolineae bacterium]|jgi:ABC-2 type transport system permease protein|nr:ABC transporter permease [Anaerolineae bacterium]
MAVLIETLRRHWRGALMWSLGLTFYSVYTVMFIPDLAGLQALLEVFESFPTGLLQVFGFTDISTLATPEGFLGINMVYTLVLLSVYAVFAGLSLTANEEDSGVMDMVLALPLHRYQVIVEKFIAYTLLLVVIGLACGIGTIIGDQLNPNVTFDPINLLIGNLNVIPSAMLIVAFTGFIGTLVRRRNTAAAIAGLFIAFSFLADNFARGVDHPVAQTVRTFSFFRYADLGNVLLTGVVISSLLVLLIATAVLVGSAVFLFQRRDIAV